MKPTHEVLVVGAGPAGLGAAMALARLRRSVVVCDDDRPRNAPAAHMHNIAGHEGLPPRAWREKARADLRRYDTVEFVEGSVAGIERAEDGFVATLSSQRVVRAQKVILAYGVQDRLPPIPGIRELWGRSVFHCPFCHGYEHRDGRVGVISDGPPALHMLSLLSGLTSDLILFTNGKSGLTPKERASLLRRGIESFEAPVDRIVHQDGELKGVLVEGRLISRSGILVTGILPYHPKSDLGERLGCERGDAGLYKMGEGNRTTVKGVYAAGDIMNGLHSVVAALASGQVAGATAAKDLLQDAFQATTK